MNIFKSTNKVVLFSGLICSILFSSPVFAQSDDRLAQMSYSKLAAEVNSNYYRQLIASMFKVTKDTYPHDVKCLRKEVGYMKILVDVFMFAYTDKDGDEIRDFRGFLDDGYAVLGDYKDEMDRDIEISTTVKKYRYDSCNYDVPKGILETVYDRKRLKPKREKMLKWVKVFIKKATNNYKLLLKVKEEIVLRSPKKLSRFYWGGLNLQPDGALSGLDNIKYLQRSLSERAITELDVLLSLETIHQYENEESFHDFRKRVRSIIRIDMFFPQVKSGDSATELLEKVSKIVGKFGDVNDLFLKYHDTVKEEEKKELEVLINSEWQQLKEKLIDKDIKDLLLKLQIVFS